LKNLKTLEFLQMDLMWKEKRFASESIVSSLTETFVNEVLFFFDSRLKSKRQ
jgi:hypothetical protein